jgi:pantoate--beta-alanine ligase
VGGKEVAATLQKTRQELAQAGMVPDYVALVHAHTLEPIAGLIRPARLIAAAKLGTIRLLDNVPVG